MIAKKFLSLFAIASKSEKERQLLLLLYLKNQLSRTLERAINKIFKKGYQNEAKKFKNYRKIGKNKHFGVVFSILGAPIIFSSIVHQTTNKRTKLFEVDALFFLSQRVCFIMNLPCEFYQIFHILKNNNLHERCDELFPLTEIVTGLFKVESQNFLDLVLVKKKLVFGVILKN